MTGIQTSIVSEAQGQWHACCRRQRMWAWQRKGLARSLLTGLAVLSQGAYAQNGDHARSDAAVQLDAGFGPVASVTSVHSDPSLGATFVTFITGARLVVKPTHLAPGQVSVIASFGSGRSGVPDILVHALWATTLFPLGGTTKLSYAGLDQWQQTSGHPVNVTLLPAVSAFQLQGDAPSSELRNELALLTAYARDPGFEPEIAEKIAIVGPMIANQIDGDPAADFARGVQSTLVGPRYQELPERADIEATNGKELPDLLKASLSMAADIAVVGDVSVEDAVRATAETLASGVHRPTARLARAEVLPSAPRREPVIFRCRGAEGDGWFGEYWRLPDYASKPQVNLVAEVAAALVEDRLRREPTLTLSPAAPPVVSVSAPIELKGGAAFGVALKIPPQAVTSTRMRIARIIAELAHGPIESEPFKRARLAVVASRAAEQSANAWWARQLTLVLRDPSLARAMPHAGDVTSITPAAVSGFLKTNLIGRRPLVVAALPTAAPTTPKDRADGK
jgi:zinc protease